MKKTLGLLLLLYSSTVLAQPLPSPSFNNLDVNGRLSYKQTASAPASITVINGASVAFPATVSSVLLRVTGTIATATITLPATASITNGSVVRISTSGTITTFTVAPNIGQAVAHTSTTLSASTPLEFYWDSVSSTWRPLSGGSGAFNPSNIQATGGSLANVNITGGTITGAPISGSTGAFTNLSASGTLTVAGAVSGAGFAGLLANPSDIGSISPARGFFTNLNVSGTLTGAAFDNIVDFASPPILGSTTPNTVNATNLTASGTVSGAGFTTRFAAPGPVGSVTPSTGSFTTLSASGALTANGVVSGTGITNLFASPPPIGSAVSANGTFNTLKAVTTLLSDQTIFAGAATNADWLTPIIGWPVARSVGVMLSRAGTIGVTNASQTLNLNPIAAGTTQITIGNAAFALANNPGTYPNDYFGAYGFYGEARVYPGTVSTAFAAELNAVNLTGGTVGSPTPYQDLFLAGTHALRLASGGGQSLSPSDALAALSITGNDAKFQAGIIFTDTAITGTDGLTGYGEAVQMARGHMLSWYRKTGGVGVRTSFIASTMDDIAVNPVSLQFQNNATLFLQNNSTIGFSIAHVASSVNGVEVAPSPPGNPVTVRAIGSDTNIPLALTPKGSSGIVTNATLLPASSVVGSVLNMRAAQTLSWVNGSNSQLAVIKNEVTDPAKITSLTFQDTGTYFYGAGGGLITTFGGQVGGVNYLAINNATTGNPGAITATGADTNVGVTLNAKGSGPIVFNSPTVTSLGAFGTGALSASGTVSGAGFVARFASPGPIGNGSSSTGSFTTLQASSTVSGAGFDTYTAGKLSSPSAIGNVAPNTGAFTALTASGTVGGTGFVDRFASPGPIGNVVPGTGAFTTLSASGTVSGAGVTARFASPGPIGNTLASTGAFSTLTASSTVGGTGFVDRFASPGPIGNVAASTGAFTTLSSTGAASLGIGSANYLVSAGAASGSSPSFTATGSDATINIELIPKGYQQGTTRAPRMIIGTQSQWAAYQGAMSTNTNLYVRSIAASVPASMSPFNVFYMQPTGGNLVGGLGAFNTFQVVSDAVNMSAGGGGYVLYVSDDIRAGAAGNRVGVTGDLGVSGTSNDFGSYYIVGLYGNVGATVPQASNPNTKGHLFGANLATRANTGATGWTQQVGLEIDIRTQTGASVQYTNGLTIVHDPSHAVQASIEESAIAIGDTATYPAAPTSPGWKDAMLRFGGGQGYWGAAPTANLIDAYLSLSQKGSPPMRAARGIEFSKVKFGTAAVEMPGMTVTPAGSIRVGSNIISSTSTGVVITAAGKVGSLSSIVATGSGYVVGDLIYTANKDLWEVTSVDGSGGLTGLTMLVAPVVTSGAAPANPAALVFAANGSGATINITWADAYAVATAGGRIHANRVVTAAGAVSVTKADDTVVVNKTVGAATIVNLPSSPVAGQRHSIKDGKCDAAANNLTLTPAAGTIDGAATLVLNTNCAVGVVEYNGTQWNRMN